MRYELKKVFGNRYLLMLLFAVVIVNAWLFYGHCTEAPMGFTLRQVQEKFPWTVEALETEPSRLRERMDTVTDYRDDSLLTGNLLKEVRLNRAILQRKEETAGYGDYLAGLLAEMQYKLEYGLLGDDDRFAVRSMESAMEAYGRLRSLIVEEGAFAGVEVLLDWQTSDVLLLLFVFVGALLLLTEERRSGLMVLLRPMKKGGILLFLRKAGAMAVVLLLGFLLIYGANLFLCGVLLGFGNLQAPIQSVYGMQGCPEPLTVLGFLLEFLGHKLLWACAVTALSFLICAGTDRPAWAVGGIAAVFALSLGMENSNSLWLRALSLTGSSHTEQLFTGCIYLNFFGTPLRQSHAVPMLHLVLLMGSFLGGMALFVKLPAVTTAKGGCISIPSPHGHTRLLAHEGWKILGMQGGLLVLAVLLLVQLLAYGDATVHPSEWETYYRSYSDILSGFPSGEKDTFLSTEADRFRELQEQIQAYYTQAGEDAVLAEHLTRELQQKLRPLEAFAYAEAQYRSLRPGQSYIYSTGYRELFSAKGIRADLMNTAKLVFALILTFSGVFAVEWETRVTVLQTTAGASRRILRRKLFVSVGLVLVAMLIAYLPQYLVVYQSYGLPQLGAQANSLSILASVPGGISIRGLLSLVAGIRLFVAAIATAVIFGISHKTKHTVLTMLICLGLLLLPLIVTIICIQ